MKSNNRMLRIELRTGEDGKRHLVVNGVELYSVQALADKLVREGTDVSLDNLELVGEETYEFSKTKTCSCGRAFNRIPRHAGKRMDEGSLLLFNCPCRSTCAIKYDYVSNLMAY